MRGTEDNNSNRSGGATNVGKDVGEEEELPDSREDDPMRVAEDAQLQGKCPALLRQFKGQLPAVIQSTMELKRNRPQLTTENTEALHTWQLLEEMMEAILKLAKDTDAALATCFVKLQDLHRSHTEMVKNPLKEEKRRNKDYLKNEAQKFKRKHQKINEEIANITNELDAAQREAGQIDKCIADLDYQVENESKLIESTCDEVIKDVEKECEYLVLVKEIFGADAGLVNILEAMDRFQFISIQGDNVHPLLCRMLENILSRYSDWLESMEDLAEDPRDDDCLDEVRIAREYIANPNIPRPNPFLDMETEPENAGKKLLEY